LRLEGAAEDRIAGFVGRRFKRIESRLGLQGGDIGSGQVEGGTFAHLVGGGIVDAADQHADMAHAGLLGHVTGFMRPQSPVPGPNVTQRLFALTMKANGRLAPKVFKLAKTRLPAHQTLRLSKKHSFRAISTRAYYPGQHVLEIQINVTIYAQQPFELI
jgi:hypothetical protein